MQPGPLMLALSDTHCADTITAASSANSIAIFQALLNAGFDINLSLGHVGDALR